MNEIPFNLNCTLSLLLINKSKKYLVYQTFNQFIETDGCWLIGNKNYNCCPIKKYNSVASWMRNALDSRPDQLKHLSMVYS